MELNLLPFITHKHMSQKDERYFLVFLSNTILGAFKNELIMINKNPRTN